MKSLRSLIKRYYKKRLLPRLRRELGIDDLREDFMTVLDSAADITQCRPATGTLRRIQLGDLELLRLFDILCEKNGLTYWLDWGTLLGAVRHGGFIPWDDDLDVCMPREDYNKAIPLITAYFSGKDGFCVETEENANEKWLWVNYWTASVLIDIFPIDSIPVPETDADEAIRAKAEAARNNTGSAAAAGDGCCSDRAFFYAHSIAADAQIYRSADIFPLRRIPFETYDLCVPANYRSVLTAKYGDYMSFPRGGIAHHKGIVGNPSFSEAALAEVTQRLRDLQQELLTQ